MTLEEIKDIIEHRTPEFMVDVFERKLEYLDQKVIETIRTRKLLHTLKKTIQSNMSIDENSITVQFMPVEAIVLGNLNDYSRSRNDYDALLDFYNTISENYPDLDMNYPVWGTFSQERLKQKDWKWPDRYYFYNPEGHDKKPAALYAIGYMRGGYGQSDELFNASNDYGVRNGEMIWIMIKGIDIN